ncbi:MAG: hypothetical protein U9R73_11970 [Pseudomonadota bacterium]|jgi:hypothetical protein|nr:hypothetical protein [Pseudomonadota bacterium]
MRPVRAFAVMAAALALWSTWRFEAARETFAAMLAAHARPAPAARPQALKRLVVSPRADIAAASPAGTPSMLPVRAFHAAPSAGVLSGPAAPTAVAGTVAQVVASVPVRRDAPTAHDFAASGYTALALGDRRTAARQFDAALAADPGHANAALWQAERAALHKAWHVDAYSLVRSGGAGFASDRPLLGGGQSGIRLGYTPGPLARRPIELFGRLAIAHDWLDLKGRSAQGALGAAWMPLGRDGPAVSGERLIAIGREGRNAWAIRVSGGAWHAADAKLPIDLSAYAEAGVVGASSRDGFAGAQALALYPVAAREGTRIGLGGGVWGSVQDGGGRTASRLEFGPGAQLSQRIGTGTIELRGEYRFRVAGDAAPDSGPALTIATRF